MRSSKQNHVKLRFDYNPLRDARNILESSRLSLDQSLCYLVGCGGSIRPEATTWQQLVRATSAFEREHDVLIREVIASLINYWAIFRKPVLLCLQKIFGETLPPEVVDVYLTSCTRCPYDPTAPSFMVSIWASPLEAVYTCAHELFHIHFWTINKRQIRTLRDAACSELLESFIAILNEELPKYLPVLGSCCRTDSADAKLVRDVWRKTKNLRQVEREVWKQLAKGRSRYSQEAA